MSSSTNIYGVNELLGRCGFIRREREPLVPTFISLIESEYEASTLYELINENDENTPLVYLRQPMFTLVFESVLHTNSSDSIFYKVKTIIKRIGKHSKFGKTNPNFWMQRHNFNDVAEDLNPKFMFKT